MNRNVKDSGVVVKDRSSSFSDVNIPIKNNYFFATKLFLCDFCSYSRIIEKAEAADSRSMSMMPWWSDDSE